MKFKKQLPKLEKPNGIYFITFVTWERLELTPEARQVVLDACRFVDRKRYHLFAVVIMTDHVHLLIQTWRKTLTSGNYLETDRNYLETDRNYLETDSEQDARTPEFWSLGSIMHSIKSYSSKQIPKVMKHTAVPALMRYSSRN